MNPDTEQLICQSQPFCLCAGLVTEVEELDECDCFPAGGRQQQTFNLFAQCVACGEPMVVINFETGEEVTA